MTSLLHRKRYWATFGETGKPNVEGPPLWPSYTLDEKTHDSLLRFDVASEGGVKVQSHTRETACDWMEANIVPN